MKAGEQIGIEGNFMPSIYLVLRSIVPPMTTEVAANAVPNNLNRVVSENGIYGHSRFCNTDFDDKLACLNLSGV
jgi:hypothetical protein